jgi:hypothetical protein
MVIICIWYIYMKKIQICFGKGLGAYGNLKYLSQNYSKSNMKTTNKISLLTTLGGLLLIPFGCREDSDDTNPFAAYYHYIINNTNIIYSENGSKSYGLSVRCVMD